MLNLGVLIVTGAWAVGVFRLPAAGRVEPVCAKTAELANTAHTRDLKMMWFRTYILELGVRPI